MFGRIAFTYYKSGTGSGGMVNAPYVTNILDSLKECKDISVNEELEAVYQDWIRENPFDMGEGWAQEPWSQKEMPVSEALAQKAAASSDLAVVVLAGQQARTWTTAQSRKLSADSRGGGADKPVAAALNGPPCCVKRRNIIDMKWVTATSPRQFCSMAGRSGGRTRGGRYPDRRSEPLW